MTPFDSATIVALGGLAIGLTFGATAQRTNFCTMGGISDLLLIGDGRRFRAWILAMAVALAGSQALHLAGVVDLKGSIYLSPTLAWAGAVLGGLLFGFGMTLAGGCGNRNLVRLGAGNLKSLVVVLMIAVFGYMTMRGLLAPARLALESLTALDLAGRGLPEQGLPAIAAAASGIGETAWRAILASVVALAFVVYCFGNAAFRASPRNIVAGATVGVLVVAGWYVTGVLGRDEFAPTALASVTFVAPVGEGLHYLMAFTGARINFGIAVVGGVIAGSSAAALASGEFRLEAFADRHDLLRHLGGGALMGCGGVLALGCTIGQGVTGFSTLALGSILAWLSIVAGGMIGIRYLEEGTLLGAVRATFARS